MPRGSTKATGKGCPDPRASRDGSRVPRSRGRTVRSRIPRSALRPGRRPTSPRPRSPSPTSHRPRHGDRRARRRSPAPAWADAGLAPLRERRYGDTTLWWGQPRVRVPIAVGVPPPRSRQAPQSTQRARGADPAGRTRPIGRKPAGRPPAEGNVASSAWSSPPAERRLRTDGAEGRSTIVTPGCRGHARRRRARARPTRPSAPSRPPERRRDRVRYGGEGRSCAARSAASPGLSRARVDRHGRARGIPEPAEEQREAAGGRCRAHRRRRRRRPVGRRSAGRGRGRRASPARSPRS